MHRTSRIASISACERVDIAKKEDASYDDSENADADGGAEADADDAGVGAREIIDDKER